MPQQILRAPRGRQKSQELRGFRHVQQAQCPPVSRLIIRLFFRLLFRLISACSWREMMRRQIAATPSIGARKNSLL
jgi:hypothetical protein